MPVSVLKARLKGPSDWKPESERYGEDRDLGLGGIGQCLLGISQAMAVEVLVEVPKSQTTVDRPAELPLAESHSFTGQHPDGQAFLAIEPLDRHQAIKLGQQRRIGGSSAGLSLWRRGGRWRRPRSHRRGDGGGDGEQRVEIGLLQRKRDHRGDQERASQAFIRCRGGRLRSTPSDKSTPAGDHRVHHHGGDNEQTKHATALDQVAAPVLDPVCWTRASSASATGAMRSATSAGRLLAKPAPNRPATGQTISASPRAGRAQAPDRKGVRRKRRG